MSALGLDLSPMVSEEPLLMRIVLTLSSTSPYNLDGSVPYGLSSVSYGSRNAIVRVVQASKGAMCAKEKLR